MNITVGNQVFDDQKQAYTLTDQLGRGGFGAVYKAIRDTDHRIVAVKFFSSDFASKESMLSFQKELHQSLLIKSEYVVDYLYAHDGNTYPELPPYIIMEYADGGSLNDLLIKHQRLSNAFSSDEITNMFMQLCNGMKAVNQLLVHRDIKPENILVCNGKLKIGDFGLSKIAADTTKSLTFKGYGSVKYIAPEAWDNDHATVQMDIYSMGIVFYEIATLAYPYRISINADYLEYRNAHCYQAPNSTPLRNANLGAGVVSAIIKMMEKPVQSRYADWDSIIEAISKGNSPTSDDEISSAVERALSNRNEFDIAQQEAELSAKQEAEEKANHNRLIYSQLENTIINPIIEYIDQYNSKYQGQAKFSLQDFSSFAGPKNFNTTKYINTIHTPNGQKITIETEVIYQENFKEQYKDIFNFIRVRHYHPHCNNKKILAWICISDQSGIGFNLLLLENVTSMYGDWFIMVNRNNGLGSSRRPEPFGFQINELPKEIQLIHAAHIYCSEIMPFSCSYLLDYLGNYVS